MSSWCRAHGYGACVCVSVCVCVCVCVGCTCSWCAKHYEYRSSRLIPLIDLVADLHHKTIKKDAKKELLQTLDALARDALS